MCEKGKNTPKVNKSVSSKNKRKWMKLFRQTGYTNPFVREYFVGLKNKSLDSKGLKSTAKFFTGYLDKHERGDFFINGNTNTKFRLLGAGPPKRAVEG